MSKDKVKMSAFKRVRIVKNGKCRGFEYHKGQTFTVFKGSSHCEETYRTEDDDFLFWSDCEDA